MAAIPRRWFLKGGLALGATSLALVNQKAMARDRISVNNAKEFFDAIGSNRKIVLEPGIYLLSDLPPDSYQDHATFQEVFDGYQLVINNVENLKIVGRGNLPVRLLVSPRYANILNFENCNNIEIDNIQGGHWPEKGTCHGGVLYFKDTRNINIEDCILFGSGTWGIKAFTTENLTCLRTSIQDCTYNILNLYETNTATFIDCQFYNNKRFDMVSVDQSRDVEFRNCHFSNNIVDLGVMFFRILESEPVRLIDCLLNYNQAKVFVEDLRLLKIRGTRFENNSFKVNLGDF